MNAFRKTFALSMWVEYYRFEAQLAASKLVDDYPRLTPRERLMKAKYVVDNIERMKGVLGELMKLKYKPFSQEEYNGIILALSKLQWYLLKQDYSKSPGQRPKEVLEDLAYVVYALNTMRKDMADISLGKKKPMWFSPAISDKVKKIERKLQERYYSLFKEPISVFFLI